MRQQPGYRQGGSTTCSGPQPVLQLFQTELLSEAGLAGSGPLSEHRHPSQVSVPGLSGVGVGASSSQNRPHQDQAPSSPPRKRPPLFLPFNSFPESHNSPFITERGDKSQASLYPQLRSQSSGPGGAWGQPQARRQQTCPSLETSSAAGGKQDGWRGKREIAPRSIRLWGLRHPLQSLHRLPFKGPKRNQPEALYIYIYSLNKTLHLAPRPHVLCSNPTH